MFNPTIPTNPPLADYEICVDRAIKLANDLNGGLDLAEEFLTQAGWGHFGREYANIGNRTLCYLNMGDTYDLTIGETDSGEIIATTWGDWYETTEQAYESENNVFRCGYCGEYADRIDGVEWRFTPCNCGYYVDGSKIDQ